MLKFHTFVTQMPSIECNDDVKLQHHRYIINLLLSFLKQIRKEPNIVGFGIGSLFFCRLGRVCNVYLTG